MLSRGLSLSRKLQCCLRRSHRMLLSGSFKLNDEWHKRHEGLHDLGITSGYEWISVVQKKFASAGLVSAVDVDAAVCGATESDQIQDVVRIVYKLRHTENTCNTLPSTEYALVRLLLKHNELDMLMAIIGDPINYGIFFNEHSACLTIDSFLNANNIPGAAKVASVVMQQEMFSSTLLNLLCLYSAIKWTELPTEKRIFDETTDPIISTDSFGTAEDDEEKIFKFPYLKNDFNDEHFDLTDANHLVGKSLSWFVDNLTLNGHEANSLRLVGSVFFEKFDTAKNLLSMGDISTAAISVCASRVEQLLANEGSDDVKKELSELKALFGEISLEKIEENLSEIVKKRIKDIQASEEDSLLRRQCEEFNMWRENRIMLVKAQAERLDLNLKLEEVKQERQKLTDRWEMLNFFENRLKWEDMARIKDELASRDEGSRKSKEEQEQEYVEKVFLKRNMSVAENS